MTSFLLGGRAWVVVEIIHADRVVSVRPAPRGKKPTWGGFAPKHLGLELCQRIRALLSDDAPIPYLSDAASVALAGYRDDLRELLRRTGNAIQIDGDAARWWTYAGGRINQTLKHALQATQGWKIVADNFHLRIEGDGITHGTVEAAILDLAREERWRDVALWERIIAALPPYRLSKFQPALPPRFQPEMIGRYLLDLEGTQRWLGVGVENGVELLRAALSRGAVAEVMEREPPIVRPARPVRMIEDVASLEAFVGTLASERVIALDVETTLIDHELCTLQIGTPAENVIVDALAVRDLAALAPILEDSAVLKIIHNATFERGVLAKVNLALVNVLDTLQVSRRVRGKRIDGGHSLAVVCARELGRTLDKSAQTSDWTRRPLTERQIAYAALDVEVLIDLERAFAPLVLVS
jgi:ATP-dependent Lhr-like helicase